MNQMEKERKTQRYFGKVLEVGASLILVGLIFFVFALVFRYIVPFVLAAILTILFLPLVRWLERLGMPRVLSVWVAMLGSLIIFLALFSLAAVATANEVSNFSSHMAPYFSQLDNWLSHPSRLQAVFLKHIPAHIASQIQLQLQHSLSGVQQWIQVFADGLLSIVTKFPDWLFMIGIALIATYFMLVRQSSITENFRGALPPGWDLKIPATIREMIRAFLLTLRVQLVLMGLSGVLAVISMFILHIPDAVVLGVLFGISGIVPIVGSAIITIPWAVGALVIGDTTLAIKVLLIQVVITLIVHLITPKITANSVGLDPLSTLFALYVGMKVMGFTGIFIGPVLLIGIKSILRKHLVKDLFPGVQQVFEQQKGGD